MVSNKIFSLKNDNIYIYNIHRKILIFMFIYIVLNVKSFVVVVRIEMLTAGILITVIENVHLPNLVVSIIK